MSPEEIQHNVFGYVEQDIDPLSYKFRVMQMLIEYNNQGILTQDLIEVAKHHYASHLLARLADLTKK